VFIKILGLILANSVNINNIVIFLVGEDNKDPAPIYATHKCLEKFHSEGVPLVVCHEGATDRLENTIQELNASIRSIQRLQVGFADYVANIFREITVDDVVPNPFVLLKKYIKNKLEEGEKKCHTELLIERIYQNYCCFSNLQCRSTLLRWQKKNDIPLIGIDMAFREEILKGKTVPKSKELIQLEMNRVRNMTQEIFEKALPLIKQTGGIIFVNLAAFHVKFLASSILQHISELQLTKSHSFAVIPMDCALDKEYYQDLTKKVLAVIQKNQIQYREVQVHPVDDFKELKKGVFYSPKFFQLMTFAGKSFRKKNQYYISNYCKEKRNLVERLGGRSIRSEGPYTVIEIASELLSMAAHRKVLGIQQRRNKDPIRLVYLRTLKGVTIGCLPDSMAFLATFPLDILKHSNSLLGNLKN